MGASVKAVKAEANEEAKHEKAGDNLGLLFLMW
jgi:hypothetical protein